MNYPYLLNNLKKNPSTKTMLKNLTYLLKYLPKQKLKKLVVLSSIIFLYLLYKSKKKKIQKLYKKNLKNLKILKHLSKHLKTYSPTFYLPGPFSMIIAGSLQNPKNFLIKFEKQKILFKDKGEMNLEWYPPNYNEIQKPIVAFILGSLGTSHDTYAKEYAKLVKKKGWRFVILNRRGFDSEHLKSSKFMCKDEMMDFCLALEKIYDVYKCSIYLCGVSAGANHGTKLLGLFKGRVPVKAFVSISNPFNFGTLAFYYRKSFVGNLVSRYLSRNYKVLLDFHSKNPNFKNILKENNKNYDLIESKMKDSYTLWELDKNVTIKLAGFDHVMDYYHNLSCGHLIEHIEQPSLFISCLEDPICYKESIPITQLYRNKNVITLFAERGGHIEYLSGLKREWWAFKTSLEYFDYFETCNDTKELVI